LYTRGSNAVRFGRYNACPPRRGLLCGLSSGRRLLAADAQAVGRTLTWSLHHERQTLTFSLAYAVPLALLAAVASFVWQLGRAYWNMRHSRRMSWLPLGGCALLSLLLVWPSLLATEAIMFASWIEEREDILRRSPPAAILAGCTILMDARNTYVGGRDTRENGIRKTDRDVTLWTRRFPELLPPSLRHLSIQRATIREHEVHLVVSGGFHHLGIYCCRPPGKCHGSESLGPGVEMYSF
jgi:hypothetical protein